VEKQIFSTQARRVGRQRSAAGRLRHCRGREDGRFLLRTRDGCILRFVELVGQKRRKKEEVDAPCRIDFDEAVGLRIANGHHRPRKNLEVSLLHRDSGLGVAEAKTR